MLTSQELETLSATALFHGYTAQELGTLAEQFGWEKRSFTKGQVIYSPDHFRKELACVLSGQVLVTKGDGELVVSLLEPTDLFGAAALFNAEAEYVSTLTARSRSSVLFLTQDSVRQLIDSQPLFRGNYIRYLSCRIRFLSDKIDSLIRGSGEKKLSGFLLRQMDSDGQVKLACSMTELAARLNIGRASLYRELQKLEARGILTRSGKTIVIQQPDTLSRV